MEILKNRILVIVSFFFVTSFQIQKRQPIDIETVKKDIIASPDNTIPSSFVLKKRTFLSDMYVDDMCFVHLQYKDYSSECFMKLSEVAVYQFQGNKWNFRKLLPYFYDISLVNEKWKVFISNNEFCEPNGTCNTYFELNEFDGDEFKRIISYKGFSKYLYYQGLLGKNEKIKLDQAVGDTISDEYILTNIKVKSRNDISLDRMRRTKILEGYSDTLKTTISTSFKTVILKD